MGIKFRITRKKHPSGGTKKILCKQREYNSSREEFALFARLANWRLTHIQNLRKKGDNRFASDCHLHAFHG
jgi:hypothetical protein